MSITKFGGLAFPSSVFSNILGVPQAIAAANVTIAVTSAAIIVYGRIVTSDGGSHTIDTTASSSLGWNSNVLTTFANAGSSVKIGLAAIDTGNGPPARASNAAGVINFDVSATLTGGGGGILTAWNTTVPTAGTKTIANGDLVAFAIQFIVRAGADSITLVTSNPTLRQLQGGTTSFNGTATYSDQQGMPNVFITFADGATGVFYGSNVQSAVTGQTWNSGSSPSEYGNLFTFPVPVSAVGIAAMVTQANDCDYVLYSDPLGTPVAQKTVSVDANTLSVATTGVLFLPFPAPLTLLANTPYAAIIKPGASSVTTSFKSFNAAAHQVSEYLGTACYAVNRSSGAFAVQNSQKDRFAIGLLFGGVDNGVNPIASSAVYG